MATKKATKKKAGKQHAKASAKANPQAKRTAKRTTQRRQAKGPAGNARRSPMRAGTRPPTPADSEARFATLVKVFTALGARDPELWARKHVEEGTDEVGRFVLLRALWLRLVEPGRVLARAREDEQAGEAVGRLMSAASLTDLDALIRYAQRTSLDDVCRVLDDPADHPGDDEEHGIRWALFRIDAQGTPLWPLDRLRAGLAPSEPR